MDFPCEGKIRVHRACGRRRPGVKPLLADKLVVNGTAALTDILASPQEYEQLLGALKERIRTAQLEALRVVNQGLITLYMDIGRMIVERQQRDTWGKSVVANLARDLRVEFPGANGFSAANLWRMKIFFEAYGESEKLAQRVRVFTGERIDAMEGVFHSHSR